MSAEFISSEMVRRKLETITGSERYPSPWGEISSEKEPIMKCEKRVFLSVCDASEHENICRRR